MTPQPPPVAKPFTWRRLIPVLILVAGLVAFFALGLERYLARRKRGLSTLVLSLLWLVLAWRGSGRPYHLSLLEEPLLAPLLGVKRLPCAETLRRRRQ